MEWLTSSNPNPVQDLTSLAVEKLFQFFFWDRLQKDNFFAEPYTFSANKFAISIILLSMNFFNFTHSTERHFSITHFKKKSIFSNQRVIPNCEWSMPQKTLMSLSCLRSRLLRFFLHNLTIIHFFGRYSLWKLPL